MEEAPKTARGANATATAALLVLLAFALGFAEFVLIGITSDVAEGLGTSLTLVGDVVGYYALACAVATPVVALATASASRFKVMAVLLAVFNVGNLATLFAGTYPVLLASRMLPAVTSGTLIALALAYVPDIVGGKRAPHVVGLVLAGFSTSSVIGVPIGTALAGAFGWRAAYVCVFALGIVASVLLLPALARTPSPKPAEAVTLRAQLRILADPRILANIAMILAGAGSTYVFYTYLTPILETVAGFDTAAVSIVLALFGAACVGSNLISGAVASRFGMRALPVTFALHAALLAALGATVATGALGVANIVAVGLLMYVMNSTVQMLFQNVARTDYPAALTFSASLHPMSFNAGIALGSFVGGAVVNAAGLTATGPAGGALAFAAAVVAFGLVRLGARRSAAAHEAAGAQASQPAAAPEAR